MSTNFAPYQDESPEIERALSPPPPPNKSRPSIDSSRARSPPLRPQNVSRNIADVQQQQPFLPSPDDFANNDDSYNRSATDYEAHTHSANRGRDLEAFQTSLPLRLDYEAMLAYILLPPAGGVLLLLLEHKSDYVRFHAWQSSMLFTCIFIIHLIFSRWAVISWILFAIDLLLIAGLSMRAYRDVDTLEHFEVPVIGRLANKFVDDE